MPVAFLEIANLFQRIETLSRPNGKAPPQQPTRNAVKEIIFEWFGDHRSEIAHNAKTLVAILSTLLPDLRPDRVYSLREDSLAKVLTKALHISGTRRETVLIDYRTSTEEGDLGSAIQKVVSQAETSKGGIVTVDELDEVLGKLAARVVFTSKELRERWKGEPAETWDLLKPLFFRLNSFEAKWVTRCILKSLTPVIMPVQDNLVKACIQVCSEEIVRSCPIAQPGPKHRREWLRKSVALVKPEIGVKVGRAEFVKAQSCKHAIAQAKGRKMMMERKHDGEYCQIHIDLSKGKDWIKVFSKSGKESTEDRRGIHDPLRQALKINDSAQRQFKERCILEGEMVVYSSRRREIMPFDHIRRHVTRSGVYIGSHNDPRPSPCSHLMVLLFDILLMDDHSLLSYPLSERISRLHRVLVSPKRSYCEMVERILLDFSEGESTTARLKRYFSRGITNRWEGFVLKPYDAPYFNLLGDRPDKTTRGHGFWSPNDCAWIKLKKDYITGLGDAADFAVVAGAADRGRTYAAGHAVGDLNTFHIAVLTNKRDVKKYGVKPKLKVVFEVTYSITRSDLEYIRQCAYFDAVKYEPKIALESYDLIEAPRELRLTKPTHIFSHPLIFEITGGGFEKQTDCTFFTPRHPRVSKVHWDREFTDALSYEELQNLAEVARSIDKGGSQEERMWIARLERGDIGKQLELTPRGSAGSEATPPGASVLPKRNRHVFSATPSSASDDGSLNSGFRSRDVSPLFKKQRWNIAEINNNLKELFAVASEVSPSPSTSNVINRKPQTPQSKPDSGTAGNCNFQTSPGSQTERSPLATLSQTSFKTPPRPCPNDSKKLILPTPYFTALEHQPRSSFSSLPSTQPTPVPTNKITTPLSTSPPTPSRKRKRIANDETSPLLGAKVYVIPTLMKFEHIFSRLIAHGVESFDEFLPENVAGVRGGIVIVESQLKTLTKNVIKAVKELGDEEGAWGLWDWRVVDKPTVEEMRPEERVAWSCWKVWDI
ncbi:hypothetical protein BDD12DRAFT_848351 [Trichophaea hybrida]|nr:hypothetical protein BDD12DRAFT_848351 [Trichophaea hybrida]